MGVTKTTGELVRRPLTDARQAPPGVAKITSGEGSSDGSGGLGSDVGSREEGERNQVEERGRGGKEIK